MLHLRLPQTGGSGGGDANQVSQTSCTMHLEHLLQEFKPPTHAFVISVRMLSKCSLQMACLEQLKLSPRQELIVFVAPPVVVVVVLVPAALAALASVVVVALSAVVVVAGLAAVAVVGLAAILAVGLAAILVASLVASLAAIVAAGLAAAVVTPDLVVVALGPESRRRSECYSETSRLGAICAFCTS